MKKSLKAALLSGLIFPGLGQFWLKHPVRGIALLLATLASLALVVAKITKQALVILERAESEGGSIDLVAILNSAHASSLDDFTIKCASAMMIFCWVLGIVDAYALGRKMDREDQAKGAAQKLPHDGVTR